MITRNEGHGHVFPRPDGIRARCGGPGICGVCAADLARQRQARDPEPGPIDVDVAALDPGAFARLLISRGVSGDPMALAEIRWDIATRYERTGEVVLVLVGIVEQFLGWLGEERGMTARELWQDLLLNEALSDGPEETPG
jgi:hypothetical protein